MKRSVLLFAGLGVLVLALLGNALVLAPKSRERAAVRERLAAAAAEEDTLRSQLGRLERLAAQTQLREGQRERLAGLVPGSPDLASFIRALDEVAARSQVNWSSLTPAAPVPGPNGVSVGISINVGGTFFQLLDYLSGLETLSRLVVIDSVGLSPAGAGPGSPVMQAVFEGRIFSAGPAPAGSPPPAPVEGQPATETLAADSNGGGR